MPAPNVPSLQNEESSDQLARKWRSRCNRALLVVIGLLGGSGCTSSKGESPASESGGSSGAGSAGLASGGGGAATSGSSAGGSGASGGATPSGGSGAQATGGLGGAGGASGTGATGGTGASSGVAGGGVGPGGAGGSGASGGRAGASGMGGAGGGAGVPSGGSENTGANCPLPAMPAFDALPSIPALPDPFKMASGTRIATRAEWRCRRAEIGARIQHYETGTKPAPPQNLTATFSGNSLAVNVTTGGGAVRLTSTVTVPSGNGPFPAVIGVGTGGTGSLPANIFTSRGIATVTFTHTELAAQFPNRGAGAFWNLYPDPKAGAMIAWAWGISRIIDGLERTASMNRIDVSRLAVTGCSFAGKIALYAGAFDERIALTIPQESGGGGEAAWRVSQTLSGNVENLSNAQGTAWYHEDLTDFNAAPDRLPFDQHELAAMVAPRGLLVIGNPDQVYLASEAGYVSMRAASEVWKALGVADRVGFSQVGGHGHCTGLPSSQQAEVAAFVEKILLGMSTNTNVAVSPYTTSLTRWIDWQTPTLN